MARIKGLQFREPTHDESLIIQKFDKRRKTGSIILIPISIFAVFISFTLYNEMSRKMGALRYLPFLFAALIVVFTILCIYRDFCKKAYEAADVTVTKITEITTDDGFSEVAEIKQGDKKMNNVSIFGVTPVPDEEVVLIAKDRQEISCFIIKKEKD